jgi:hypothetical protein
VTRHRALARRAIPLLVGALALAFVVRPAAAQDAATRFEVAGVGDSTVTFRLGRADWVRPGLSGVAVDPRRRDVLVARLRVLAVTRDTAVALVTGQTMPIVPEHVVVIKRPPVRFFRSTAFWAGLVGGVVTGFIAGKL